MYSKNNNNDRKYDIFAYDHNGYHPEGNNSSEPEAK